jgi:hypothetical protein
MPGADRAQRLRQDDGGKAEILKAESRKLKSGLLSKSFPISAFDISGFKSHPSSLPTDAQFDEIVDFAEIGEFIDAAVSAHVPEMAA